ncbi:1-acyl-sn-glycerol-3-phosphate-acyltransferase [Dendrothele bispora CBS 962.96]|uniref:1-acyl-sn-glycerol-3-phosphate acyltransferase n=1 Tax=Dendrothele bispora (strain CBS 962.96) TaxID=1314807 RepID=A0A4V4HEP3_DENBC|nr:1-acyl-sn-glycerol-3-phosphate-acyltransferase [Dendrothele bispora CBS 962.96]
MLSLTSSLVCLSVVTFFLGFLATFFPLGRYYVRICLYLSCLVGVIAIWGAVVAIVMALQGMKYDVNWVIGRSFYYVAGKVLGIKIEVEGEEHMGTRPAVFLCNHQSFMDIFFLARMIPKRTSVMVKKSLRWTPVGPFLFMSGAIFVDRGNNAHAVKSLEATGKLMKQAHVSVWMYPEGTRHSSEESNLLPFKKGAFHLATQAGLPVVPVVTENYWRIYHQGVFEPGVVKIKVLPPISTTGFTTKDIPDLMERVHIEMLKSFQEISQKNEVKRDISVSSM